MRGPGAPGHNSAAITIIGRVVTRKCTSNALYMSVCSDM